MNNFTYFKDHNFEKGRFYIGASDIPTLALLNLKYDATPFSLWEQKTGRAESFKGNERTRAGIELEPIVLKWGLEEMGIENDILDDFLQSRYSKENQFLTMHSFTEAKQADRNYLVSHADLIIESYFDRHEDIILEAKTTGFFGGKRKDDINIGYDKDDLSSNGIPSSVYLQIQTQMLCYDINTAYVSVMIDTGIHRLYGPIKSHKKTQEKIMALAERFWWYVKNDKPPKPEIWKDIIKLNPILDKKSKTVIAGPELEKVLEMKERAKLLRKKAKDIKDELDDIKNGIGLMIGENAYLESATGDSLAKTFEVIRYSLKDYKNMSKQRFNKMVKDGFINKSEFRNLKF